MTMCHTITICHDGRCTIQRNGQGSPAQGTFKDCLLALVKGDDALEDAVCDVAGELLDLESVRAIIQSNKAQAAQLQEIINGNGTRNPPR